MKWALGTILTVTTGRLLTKREGRNNGIGDLYKLLGWMTNDEPYTHQLGRFAEECKPSILRQHPELEKVDISDMEQKGAEEWLSEQEQRFGIELDLEPVIDLHARIDPVQELTAAFGASKVVVVGSK